MAQFVLRLTAFISICVVSPLFAGGGEEADPPEVAVGERLFLETRFSEFFATHSKGEANATLPAGDPSQEKFVVGEREAGPGAFAGKTVSCRSCHGVDEYKKTHGNRTYSDFADRSPLPARADGLTRTTRNSPGLIDLAPPDGTPLLLHYDGEFSTMTDLVLEGMAGRNFGWLPSEHARAFAHIAHIIRDDDGSGDLAKEIGGGASYATLLAGESEKIPAEFRLPKSFRIDVKKSSDEEIRAAAGRLVEAYMRSLSFARDEKTGSHSGSAYDAFVTLNGIPTAPEKDEKPAAFARRLLSAINALKTPRFVNDSERELKTHGAPRAFRFGPEELAGLRVFLAAPRSEKPDMNERSRGGVGNCASCHTPPAFTDFKFHNTGASQEGYDAAHGPGAFAALKTPTLAERKAAPDRFLKPSPQHPKAAGPFASPPDAKKPGLADLGLWNVFANPDLPKPQAALRAALLATPDESATDDELLARALGRFKTPSIRDLGQSAPYLHTGGKNTPEEIALFYRDMSLLASKGKLRNADPEIGRIAITPDDAKHLAAFMRALDEDYE